jgi:putative ABC transport system permease protein
VTQVQENVRDTWIWRGLDELVRDVRDAARSLRRSWGFALGAGAVLALGIGANTAMFSVVNAVLLEPLDYPNADRIVAVETLWTNTGQPNPNVSGPDFLDWQAQNSVFEVLAHSAGEDEMATTVNGRGGFGNLRSVSPDFFAVFGRPAAAGRLLTARDTPTPQQSPTGRQTDRASLLPAVVGYSWAVANFGSAEGAVGKTFLLCRAPVEIVGVATPGFQYPDATNIWIPSGPTNRTNRDAQNYRAVGRLQPGVTLAGAQAQMRVVGERLAAEYPGNRFKNISLMPLQQRLTENVHGTLWMLMGAVTLTLLIGCANIANLLLARSANRTREMALRAALGAGRARLVRQLLTESSVLAGLAAGAGVFLAHILVQGIVTLSPANLPRVEEIRIDGMALMFALGLSAASILLFSLLPALKAARLNLSDTLKQGGAKGTVSGGSRLRAALVVTKWRCRSCSSPAPDCSFDRFSSFISRSLASRRNASSRLTRNMPSARGEPDRSALPSIGIWSSASVRSRAWSPRQASRCCRSVGNRTRRPTSSSRVGPRVDLANGRKRCRSQSRPTISRHSTSPSVSVATSAMPTRPTAPA